MVAGAGAGSAAWVGQGPSATASASRVHVATEGGTRLGLFFWGDVAVGRGSVGFIGLLGRREGDDGGQGQRFAGRGAATAGEEGITVRGRDPSVALRVRAYERGVARTECKHVFRRAGACIFCVLAYRHRWIEGCCMIYM